MPRTLTQLKTRLVQAMAEADDAESVLELVREAVRTYDFDESDVFPPPPKLVLIESQEPKKIRAAAAASLETEPYPPYEDGLGNVWFGKGRRPSWLLQALAEGATLHGLMPKPVKPKRVAKQPRLTQKSEAPYADEAGNTWTGKGRRPNWLLDALARGAPLERFAMSKPVQLKQVPGVKPKRRRGQPLAPYEDVDGNTWSGKGRRPNWLNVALDAGASLEDFSTGR